MRIVELELNELDCNECHHDGAFLHCRSAPTKLFTMQPLCILDTGDTGSKTMHNTRLQRRSQLGVSAFPSLGAKRLSLGAFPVLTRPSI